MFFRNNFEEAEGSKTEKLRLWVKWAWRIGRIEVRGGGTVQRWKTKRSAIAACEYIRDMNVLQVMANIA